MTTNLRALLSEIAGDCRVAYGVTEENYRAFCRNGAMGKMPSSTWPEHCQRRLEQIEKAIAALDAQAGMVCVGWEWLDTRDEMGWMRLNISPESTPPLSPEIKYRRIYAGPVEGGGA